MFRLIHLYIAQTQELLSVRYSFTGKVTGFTKTLSNSYGKGDSEEEGGFDVISMEIPLGITSRGSFLFLSVFFFCFVLHSSLITPLLSLLLLKLTISKCTARQCTLRAVACIAESNERNTKRKICYISESLRKNVRITLVKY